MGWGKTAWRLRRAIVTALLVLGIAAVVAADDKPIVCDRPNSLQACP